MNKYLVCCEVERQKTVAVEAANIEEAKEEAKLRLSEFDKIKIEHVSVQMGSGWVCVDERHK